MADQSSIIQNAEATLKYAEAVKEANKAQKDQNKLYEETNKAQKIQNDLYEDFLNIARQKKDLEDEILQTQKSFTEQIIDSSKVIKDNYEKTEKSIKKVLTLLVKNIKTAKGLNNSIRKSISDALRLNKILKQNVNLKEQIAGKSSKIAAGMKAAFNKISNGVQFAFEKASEIASKGLDFVTGGISKLAGKIPGIGTAASLALSGVGKVFKVMGTVFLQTLKYGTRFVKFVSSLPLVVIGAAAKIGNSLRNDLVLTIGNAVEATKEMFDISESYGSGAGKAIKNFADASSQSLLEFNDITGESVKLFGGGAQGIANRMQTMGQRLGEMGAYADIFGESLSKVTGGSAEQFNFMEKSLRALGASAEDVAYISQEAVKQGVGINEILLNMQESLNDVAKSSNVNQKTISKNFLVLRRDIINFGHLSTRQLQETSAALTKMGLSAQDASAIFGRLDTFESAAQMSAMLSQSFGMNLDALKLIKAENPQEIFEDLRDSMMSTGRSFDQLNRHEKALMASTTGMSATALKALMDFRDSGISYEDAMRRMKENTPEAKQLKAFEGMSGSLKEIRNIMQETSFFSAFFKGLRKSFVLASGLGEKFQSVSKRMEDFYMSALDFGKDKAFMGSIRGAFKPIEDTIDALIGKGGKDKGLFNVDTLKSSVKPFFKEFSDILGNVFKDDGNTLQVQRDLLDKINNVFDFKKMMSSPNNPATTLFNTGGKLVGQLLKAFTAVAPGLIEIVRKGLDGIVDLLWEFTSDKTGDNSIKGMLFDLFGLDNNDQMALLNTFQSLVDLLTSSAGPFAKLFLWINSKVLGMASDIAGVMTQTVLSKFGLADDPSEISAAKIKGLKEATAGGKGFKDLEDIAKGIKDAAGGSIFINDDEEELARYGGQLEYVLEKIRMSGTKQQKSRLEDYFKQSDISKSQMLNVDNLDDNYERVNDLVNFLKTGKGIKFKKSNDWWDESFASFFGSGGKAIVTTDGKSTEINQLNKSDEIFAGMAGGPVVGAIKYAGEYIKKMSSQVQDAKSVVVVQQKGADSSNIRPVQVQLVMDGHVLATKLVDPLLQADLVGAATDPSRTRGARGLDGNLIKNYSGGSSEGRFA